MFQLFKSKTKTSSLRIRSHLADSKGTRQSAETISMASMPLIPQTDSSAVIHDTGPGLFISGDATATGSNVPPAKKSLNFQKATALPQHVVVHDTSVQTVTTSQTTQETGATAGGATGTSLQTHNFNLEPHLCIKKNIPLYGFWQIRIFMM